MALALKGGTLPDRIEYRDEICGRGSFAQICLPDIIRQESEVITDNEFIERLDRREALSSARSEYERIDKTVKADIKKRVTKSAIAGDYFIKISDPIQVDERVTKGYSFQKVDIKRLSELGKGKDE